MEQGNGATAADRLVLREVRDEDLPIFFAQQLDSDANRMAAFTVEDPTDRPAFERRWARIREDDGTVIRAIVDGDGDVLGHVLAYNHAGEWEVSYWIGKPHWGKGIATAALAAFLGVVRTRPLFARAARDNAGSIRVLERCGFAAYGADAGYANARGEEVEEVLLRLD